MSKYSLSQSAIRDLDEISSYFAKVSIEIGNRYFLTKRKVNDYSLSMKYSLE